MHPQIYNPLVYSNCIYSKLSRRFLRFFKDRLTACNFHWLVVMKARRSFRKWSQLVTKMKRTTNWIVPSFLLLEQCPLCVLDSRLWDFCFDERRQVLCC